MFCTRAPAELLIVPAAAAASLRVAAVWAESRVLVTTPASPVRSFFTLPDSRVFVTTPADPTELARMDPDKLSTVPLDAKFNKVVSTDHFRSHLEPSATVTVPAAEFLACRARVPVAFAFRSTSK